MKVWQTRTGCSFKWQQQPSLKDPGGHNARFSDPRNKHFRVHQTFPFEVGGIYLLSSSCFKLRSSMDLKRCCVLPGQMSFTFVQEGHPSIFSYSKLFSPQSNCIRRSPSGNTKSTCRAFCFTVQGFTQAHLPRHIAKR